MLCFSSFNVYGQNNINSLFSPDTIIFKNSDTANLHNYSGNPFPGIRIDSSETKPLKGDSTLNKKSRKYDLGSQLMNMISTSDRTEAFNQQKKDYYETVNRFQPFDGKVIRSITFKKMQVFGQNVADTTQIPINEIESTVNKLHINTQTQVLQNSLIVKPGDKLNPLKLADNERLFREMSNIHDVHIIVNETNPTDDSVDVIVLTKDVFPVGFGAEISTVNSGNAGLWNKNLFGLNHEIYFNLLWDYTKTSKYGYRYLYNINNIGRTFISADASYENHWGQEAYRVDLNRNFFTPQTKYAGGASFARIIAVDNIQMTDTLLTNYSVGYYYYDFWLGRAIILSTILKGNMRQNIAVTGRVLQYNYFRQPQVSESLLYKYQTRTDFLGSISIARQAFVQSRLIYGFGKPEDIPYGMLLSATAGYEIGEFISRPYIGLNFASGSYIDNLGFYYQNIQFGSFIHNGIEQGTISLTGKYFTRLLNPIGRYKYRFFAKVNYKIGLNRYADEHITLSNGNGIRGLSSDSLKGNQVIYFNLENDCYTPQKILGFRFVYFLFLDAGIINNNYDNLFRNKLFTGFGIGVRIRNENLVFNTIQIRLAYYPALPLAPHAKYIDFSGIGNTTLETFSNTKPDIVAY